MRPSPHVAPRRFEAQPGLVSLGSGNFLCKPSLRTQRNRLRDPGDILAASAPAKTLRANHELWIRRQARLPGAMLGRDPTRMGDLQLGSVLLRDANDILQRKRNVIRGRRGQRSRGQTKNERCDAYFHDSIG